MEIFDSTDGNYHYWSGPLRYIIDEHVPIKRKRVRTKDVPSMTKKWKDAIRAKRTDAKQLSKEKSSENWEIQLKSSGKKRTHEVNSKPSDFKVFKTIPGN